MNSFDSLIFPVTNIFTEQYHPLLLFCSPLHFLQPVEPAPGASGDAEAAHFYQHGLWQPHTPVPLGKYRRQFLQVIDDIKSRKEYYIDQLNALTIDSGAAAPSAARPGQKHELIVSLLTNHGIAATDIEGQLELWQARLILCIAEVLDSEEDDLQEEISYFNEDEIAVLRSLKKDAKSPEGYLLKEVEKFKEQLKKPRFGNITKQFGAWLYLMQQEPLPAVRLWLASTRTAADQVLQRYKSAGGRQAMPILKLALPATISASGKYVVERIEAFHQATALIHRGMAADFNRIAATVPYVPDSLDSLLPYGTDWEDQWETLLYDAFPAAQDGRTDITFYLLPDHPVAGLFVPPNAVQRVETSIGKPAHGLLGILGSS